MPKIDFSHSKAEGLDVTYSISRKELTFHGWYDSFVGLEGGTMPLKEFFRKLKITKADCLKAFEREGVD